MVDTPGTNVILGRQQRLTEEYVPRADLVRRWRGLGWWGLGDGWQPGLRLPEQGGAARAREQAMVTQSPNAATRPPPRALRCCLCCLPTGR